MVFVEIKDEYNNLFKIVPFIENAKPQWSFNPIEELFKEKLINSKDIFIEKKYIFKVLKSNAVVPFIAIYYHKVFLPLEKYNNGYIRCTNKNTKAFQYFEKLDTLYKKHIKTSASIKDLWTNLNYQNKLTAGRQRMPYKVVTMGIGTLVKACIIKNSEVIIDSSNYFIGLNNEKEAYFLLGYLNSPILTKSIQIIQDEGAGGGGRNIHKRPFKFLFPKFNPNNNYHIELAEYAKKIESKAKQILSQWINNEKIKFLKKSKGHYKTIARIPDNLVIRTRAIQNKIYKELGWNTKTMEISGDFAELDKKVLNVIQSMIKNSKKEVLILD